MKVAKTNQNGTRHYIKKTKKKQDDIGPYNPHEGLVALLKKQLDMRNEVQAGRESPGDDKKKRNEIDRLKVYYLNKHIFPAMANLAFFFGAITKHPELEKIYEDDIKDLLGIRRKKPSDKSKPKPLCGFMFSDLLRNILKVSGSPFEKREIMKDYSLILNHRAEEIVRMKVRRSLPSGQYSKGGILAGGQYSKSAMMKTTDEANVHGVILSDFDRALAWTGMLASRVDNSIDDDEEPGRTFDFDTDELLRVKQEEE
jgi:hypothetical protein